MEGRNYRAGKKEQRREGKWEEVREGISYLTRCQSKWFQPGQIAH